MALERSRAFADLLRAYRRAAQMTQEQLAERAGLSVRALRKLESGTSLAPRRDTIDLLAAALKLSDEQRTLLEASASQQRFVASATPSLPGTIGPPRVDPAVMPLVGRSSELALLERHLAGEGPPLVVLAGEPGIGKTRLLQETVLRARGHGLTVLQGGCHRRSGQEPYAPLLAALASSLRSQSSAQVRRNLEGCSWLVRLLPELAESSLVPAPSWTLPPAQERRLMFAAVSRYLANIAGPSGTLLVLDDLQWAGQDALDLLAVLLRTPEEPTGRALRVVAAYRSTEVLSKDPLGMLLADLGREGLAAPMELRSLVRTEADELASMLLADLAPDNRDQLQRQLVERTGGVPYFLVSCAQALRYKTYDDEGSAALGESGTRIDGGQLPWTVTQSIRQRLALQPEATRDLLNVVAVSGRESPIAVLLAVAAWTGQDQTETMAALDVACQAGLLVEEKKGTGYAFAHDLIREVAVADLGAARNTALHRWVAEAIIEVTPSGREPPAAELAWHFSRGGEPVRALSHAIRAGEQAEAAYAHAESERHLSMALDLARELGDTEREADVLERLAGVLWGAGQMHRKLAVLEAAAELRRKAGNLDQFAWDTAYMIDGSAFWASSEESFARLRTLLTYLVHAAGATQAAGTQSAASDKEIRVRPLQPEQIAARVLPAESTQYLLPFDSMVELAEQAVPLLSARTAGRLYHALADCLIAFGRFKDAVPLAQSAVEYAQAAGDRKLLVRALNRLAVGWGYLDYPHNVLSTLETAVLVAEEAKDFEGLSLSEVNRADPLLVRGEFAEAERSLQRALEAAEQYGMPTHVAWMLSRLATLSLASGAWDKALDFCQRCTEVARTLEVAPPSLAEWNRLVQGRIFLARGEVHTAEERLQVAMQQTEGLHSTLIQVQKHAALAEADLVHAANPVALARLAPWLDRTTAYERAATDLIPLLAWAYLVSGDGDQAAALLAECLAKVREHQYRVLLADALRIQALLALRQGHWQEAEAALDEAIALAHEMPYPYAEAKARYVYGDLHAARGNVERAREQYTAALVILGQLGERLYAEQVERALAEVSRP